MNQSEKNMNSKELNGKEILNFWEMEKMDDIQFKSIIDFSSWAEADKLDECNPDDD